MWSNFPLGVFACFSSYSPVFGFLCRKMKWSWTRSKPDRGYYYFHINNSSCKIKRLREAFRPGRTRMRVDESWWELQLSLAFDRQLSSTLIEIELVQILMRVCARLTSQESWWELQNCYRFALFSSRLSKIVQNLQLRKTTSFVWVTGQHPEWSTLILVWPARMRVERTLVQTLASQLSSTLILVWPAHESWENSCANSRFSTLIYSHPRLTRP